MFTSSLTEEVKALEAQIEAVKDKVDDPIICAKIRQFVYAPKEIQDMYKADAGLSSFHSCGFNLRNLLSHTAAEHMQLLIVVLRASEEPILSRTQMHRLAKARRAHMEYVRYRAGLTDSDDDDGPQNEDAWLLEDLKILTQLHSKLRDREQLIALIFEVELDLYTNSLLKSADWILGVGIYCRFIEGYHHYFLCTIGTSLSGSEYRRFLGRFAKLYQRLDQDGRTS